MPDVADVLMDGVVTVLDADAALQSLCLRAERICVDANARLRLDDEEEGLSPVVVMLLVALDPVAGTGGDNYRAILQLTAFARGNLARQTANRMIDAAIRALTVTQLDAVGVDAAVISFSRRSLPRESGDDVGYDARADVELDVWITIPF